MDNLIYRPVTNENLDIAVKVQNEIFPNEDGKQNLIDAVEKDDYRKELLYWLVFNEENNAIGIIGLYSYHEYPNDAWMGWFGILPVFQGKGYGGKVFDFFEQTAKKLRYENIRLYTDSIDNENATKLYYKKGMVSEEYANKDDAAHSTGKTLIFSKSVVGTLVEKWDNKYLGLLEQEDKQNISQ